MAGPPKRGRRIDRYVVPTSLTEGLCVAYDPELGRQVDLWRVRIGDGTLSERTLGTYLEGCRQLARLSHPNLVAVHDARLVNGDLIVALEHVEGTPGSVWLAEAPRDWREAVQVLEQAGRGLAAAHEMSWVHGDLRADSVLLGSDGRVRVLGLERFARARDLTSEDSAAGADPPPDEKTDQFALSALLFQALYGTPPGEPPSAPAGVAPNRIRRAVLRGLAQDPADRFPTLSAFLDALVKDPPAWWRPMARLAVLVTAILFAFLVDGFGERRQDRSELCRNAALKLRGTWDPERKREIRESFLASGLPAAKPAWETTERMIDRYTQTWTTVHAEACEATWARGEQPTHVLDLRMRCLDERLGHLAALTAHLSHADGPQVQGALQAVASLPGLGRCSDVEALTALVPPPDGMARRHTWRELRSEIIEARALFDLGRFAETSRRLEHLEEPVRRLSYAPLEAEWALLHALVLGRETADLVRMEEALFQAIYAARAGRHRWVEAEAWTSLILPAIFRGELEKGLERGRFARAVIESLGDDEDLLSAWHNLYGSLLVRFYHDADRVEEGMVHLQHAATLAERHHGPDHPRLGSALNNLAFVLKDLGRAEEALKIFERSVAVHRKALGSDHPNLADALQGLGDSHAALGRCREASVYWRQALDLHVRLHGPDYPFLAFPLRSLGECQLKSGQPGEALKLLARAERVWGKDRDPELRAEILFALARAHAQLDDRGVARQLATAALAIFQAAGPRLAAQVSAIETWLEKGASARIGRRARPD